MANFRLPVLRKMGPLKKSSIPGMSYFPAREEGLSSAKSYMDCRRRLDGAEDLWRIDNNLYDLEKWAKSHPGGSEWITLTKGTDITEVFESHHISDKAARLLPKFFVREAKTTRSVPWTFDADNFYRKFKKRASAALKDVDYHRPMTKTNLMADSLVTMTLLTCLLAAKMETWSSIFIAAVFLTWTTVCGHNYFHMRDNFRMYYFDMSLMSSKDWRITHVFSHHMYPNTVWDYEVYVFEPFLQWLPRADKSFVPRFFAAIYSPFIWIFGFYVQGCRRYYSIMIKGSKMELRDLVPLIIPSAMCLVGSSIMNVIQVWLFIIAGASLLFSFIGLNAAHHHPDIFHDGDIYRDNLDWGLLELDAVRERSIVDDVPFLTLTSFGSHALHHLLPTVDHGYLPLCQPAFEQTCTEFGIDLQRFTPWQLIKGQFKQLYRVEAKKNIR